jgi:hypothetical protein
MAAGLQTCARIIGPPCDAKSFASLAMFTILVVKVCISFCTKKSKVEIVKQPIQFNTSIQ